MSSHVNVLIPAAGGSRRFAEAGISLPKGLIRFRWRQSAPRTMIEHVACRDNRLSQSAHFYVGMSDSLGVDPRWNACPMPKVDVGHTRGQAETVLRMLRALKIDDEPVLVLNSDCGFTYPLSTFIMQAGAFVGAALVFQSASRAYSYVRGMPLFYSAQEKEPISRWAMAGAYFFPRAGVLREAIERQIGANHQHAGEFYLSGSLTYMVGEEMLAVPMEREQWHCWGTPEDLARDPQVQVEDESIEKILRRMR